MTQLNINKTPGTGESQPTSNRSVVVYGPQGCGKTTHAAALAAHVGLTTIHDEGDIDPRRLRPYGTLYLTNERPREAQAARGSYAFDDAMRLAGIRWVQR